MKALCFLPFTFAAGAEGFALFAPYLILVLCVLHFVRVYGNRPARPAPAFQRSTHRPMLDAMPAAQPAL